MLQDVEADEGTAEVEESQVDVGRAFVADDQPTEQAGRQGVVPANLPGIRRSRPPTLVRPNRSLGVNGELSGPQHGQLTVCH